MSGVDGKGHEGRWTFLEFFMLLHFFFHSFLEMGRHVSSVGVILHFRLFLVVVPARGSQVIATLTAISHTLACLFGVEHLAQPRQPLVQKR